MKQYFVGLMSGTSADGIDAVVAEFDGDGAFCLPRIFAHSHIQFDSALRDRILRVSLHGSVAEICELNFELGEHFARAALSVIRKAGLPRSSITAIGSHGQTIHHLPNARTPSTLQIGEPAVIAERTRVTTVADFRVRDMAAGGQGAPLVPFADWAVFTDAWRPRIIQNIGGIANLTFLPPRARLDQVLATDTGPGNMVMDAMVSAFSRGKLDFDQGGRWAAEGTVCEPLLKKWMSHPFLRRSPPKTTGREEFGETFAAPALALAQRMKLSSKDIVATATAFTAASIAGAYQRFVFPRLNNRGLAKLEVILGGGGAKNPALRHMLVERIRKTAPARCRLDPAWPQMRTHDKYGIANSAKEALAFAMLARQTLAGRPGNVPSATGARRAVVLGKIIPADPGARRSRIN